MRSQGPTAQLRAFAMALVVLGASVAGTFLWLGGDWTTDRGRVAMTIYSAMPGFVGLLIKALLGPRHSNPSAPAVLGIRVAFGWMLVGWLLAAVAALALAVVIAPAVGNGAWFMRLQGSPQAFLRGLAVGPTLMALFALGQELGFRGFLLGTLQEQGTEPRKAMAVTTASWLIWTLPVTWSIAPDGLACLWMVCWTVIVGWFLAELRLHSRSVLPTATFWGTYTALVSTLPSSLASEPRAPLVALGVAVAFHVGAQRFRTWWLSRAR